MLAHLLKAVKTYDLEKAGSRGRKTYDLEKAGSRGMLQQPSDTSQAVDQTSHDAQVEDLICHESLSGVFEGACSETSPLREKLYLGKGEDDLVKGDWEQAWKRLEDAYHADDEISQTPKETNWRGN